MNKEDFLYSFHVLFHPFDGFWDLKSEKRGRLPIAFFYLGTWFLTNILNRIGTGYLFNKNYDVPLDLFREFRAVFLLFCLFTVANWSVTTLMDGKGYFKDIVITFGYASIPMTLLRLPAILLSNIFSASEEIYYHILMGLSWVWFLLLLFIGIMMIHDFSLGKAVGTVLLTLIGMLVITFLAVVFYNIFSVLLSFMMAAYKEISMRM